MSATASMRPLRTAPSTMSTAIASTSGLRDLSARGVRRDVTSLRRARWASPSHTMVVLRPVSCASRVMATASPDRNVSSSARAARADSNLGAAYIRCLLNHTTGPNARIAA